MKPKSLGTFSLLIAAFLYSTYGLFIRHISEELTVFPQLVMRGVIVSLIFFVAVYISKSYKKVDKPDLKLFFLRGVVSLIDVAMFIVAVNNMPLGLALFVFYAASIISHYVYGYLFLNEKITLIKGTSLLFALIGLAFVYGTSFTQVSVFPFIAAFVSGISFGFAMGVSKKLTDKYSLSQVNLLVNAIITIFAFPLIYMAGDTLSLNISPNTWFWLFGFAVILASASYIILYGYKLLEAQVASIILLSEILFALIIGFVLYQEIPSTSVIIGGGLILIALSLPNVKLQKKV